MNGAARDEKSSRRTARQPEWTGIAPRLERVLAASKFRARFEDKGRFRSYMKAIPTYVVTRKNPAFLGLARHLREIA
ncbi:MAG: glucokinase [Pseudomonadota bacterium]|nr:glucokinase [Pseudomonadota bacterium]